MVPRNPAKSKSGCFYTAPDSTKYEYDAPQQDWQFNSSHLAEWQDNLLPIWRYRLSSFANGGIRWQ